MTTASGGVEFTVTGTDETRRLDAGLVLTSIGYRGKPIRDLPFDDSRSGGAQRRRQGDRPGERETSARQLRRRLDQARTDRLHRHQQVMRSCRPCRTWSTTTTKVTWPSRRAHPPRWTSWCAAAARRGRCSGLAGDRQGRNRTGRVGPAARQVHLRRRHAGRRRGRTAALAPAAGACRPSSLSFAAASAV